MNVPLPAFFVITLAATPLLAQDTAAARPLFYIERSKNANVVHYDAMVTAEGQLRRKAPVVGYWIMKAERGQREEFNWIERRLAYGFEVRPDTSPDARVMIMRAYKKRPVTVRQIADSVRAEAVIDGRPARIHRMYITAHERLHLLPAVDSIELWGTDLETGEARYEKIVR